MNSDNTSENCDTRHCPCPDNHMMDNDSNNNDSCDMISQRKMALKIKEYNFALEDLTLYLDTHPDDSQALCLHNKYANMLKNLEDEYQRIYGPLTSNFPCKKWRWLEEPWPWERSDM